MNETNKYQRLAYERGKAEGRGPSMLTAAGAEKLREMSLAYKRQHKIHWRTDVSEEPWYKAMKDSLFAPEYEGKYWGYGRVHIYRR